MARAASPLLLQRGGRERESNPPRTGSRPLPDLKSGRPTGDDSLPEIDVSWPAMSAARRNRSSRCLLMRRRSPRRKVTPWRSKNSRIWIATLRPLSTRSRNCAAVNWAFGDVRAEIDDDVDHLRDGLAQEEMIVRDLVDLAHAAEQLEQAADVGLALASATSQCRARAAAGTARRRQAAARFFARFFRPPA